MNPEQNEDGDAASGDSHGRESSRKRSADEATSADDETDRELNPAELTSMSRSERKRYREKKRRSDLNREFDQLMTLLVEIDPEVRAEAEERARRGQWKGTAGAQEDNLLSRVDLIGRTVEVLRRLHSENEQRKAIVNQLLHAAVPGSLPSQSDDTLSGLSPARLAASSVPDASGFPSLYQAQGLSNLIMTSQGPVDGRLVHFSLNPLARQLAMPSSSDLLGGGMSAYQSLLQHSAAAAPSFLPMASAAVATQRPTAADQLLALRLLQDQNQRLLQQPFGVTSPTRGSSSDTTGAAEGRPR